MLNSLHFLCNEDSLVDWGEGLYLFMGLFLRGRVKRGRLHGKNAENWGLLVCSLETHFISLLQTLVLGFKVQALYFTTCQHSPVISDDLLAATSLLGVHSPRVL